MSRQVDLPTWRHLGRVTAICGASFVAAAPAHAISGNAAGVDASAAQYRTQTTPVPAATPPPVAQVSPSSEAPTGTPPPQAPAEASEPSQSQPLGEQVVTPEEQDVAPAEAVPAPVTADTEEAGLPFTGYVLMAVVLSGIVALGLGLILRRRTRPHPFVP